MPTTTPTSAAPFRLEGSLDLYAAAQLRATLTDCLARPDSAEFDLSGIDACDTAGLQLLLAARATAAARGHTVSFVAIPEAVEDCCRRLGLPSLA